MRGASLLKAMKDKLTRASRLLSVESIQFSHVSDISLVIMLPR
jgi:hypothetical protein